MNQKDDFERKLYPTEPPQDFTGKADNLDALYHDLSEEAKQDGDYVDPAKSFIETISDPEIFAEREREYIDIEKHWVRQKLWLETAKEIVDETQTRHGRGIRYLTLPAYYRLDVSLFLREGLIDVIDAFPNGNPRRIYVAAFEAEPTKFARMVGHFPEFRLFAQTSVEDALTNEKNPHYSELYSLFPFDIVNLDLTTSLTPKHEGPYSTTMKAIDSVFKRQADHNSKWALFLTFRNMPDEWEERALEQLLDNLQRNIDDYPSVLEAFSKHYSETRVRSLVKTEPQKCISQSVVKWLVDRAHSYGLHLEKLRCFFYERNHGMKVKYDIYKYALVFTKGAIHPGVVPTKNIPRQSWMDEDLIKCISSHKPIDVIEKIIVTLSGRPNLETELKAEIKALCEMIK